MKSVFRLLVTPLTMFVLALTLTACGGGDDSNSGSKPSPPANVKAVPGDSKATVTWDPVSGASSYNVYYSATKGDAEAVKASVGKIENAKSPCEVSGLTNDTTYYFTVRAVNAHGEGGSSQQASTTPRLKPTGASVTPGNQKVSITCNPVAGAKSYTVYYATASGVSKIKYDKKIENVVALPCEITGLTNGTTYYFVLTATTTAGESLESSEKSATPAATLQPPDSPNGVEVVGGTGKLTVTWNTKLTAKKYNIYYVDNWTSDTDPSPATIMATGIKIVVQASADPQPVSQTFEITGLTSGKTYALVITAQNAAGESGAQNKNKHATVK